MMRDWRRLYRLRGFTPFGILLVVLLAVLLAADRVTERWSAAAQRRDAVERQLATMHATLERSRQIDSALAAARARLAAVAGRVVTAPDARAAGELLAPAAEKWLVSMGASGKGAKGLDGGGRAASGAASAEVAIRVMPQQLLRILGGWQQAPLAMRLVRLEVAVDNPHAPTALEATLQVEGIFQRSEPGSKAGTPSGSSSGSNSGSRSGSRPATTDRAGPTGPRSAKAHDAR
ncbi:MAG: hypothetical protein A3G26_01445 [Betaproteobacteria bacterium RIFCSPLOWO2_12_FULL_65_110]|nr:MAG: hypothetical protein A3G26_01445 [Betaproteobacteria bacterium RIFCSPLOWO2_12_FULL_65_110]